jgi:glycosyltransferase involved in cell wall biosynthesis
VVLTVYDMIPELFPDNFRDIKRRLKNKKRNIERADKIITISRNTKKYLVEHYNVPGEKIRVIYPGAPASSGKNERIPTFQHPKPFILYVGTRKQGYKNFSNFFFAYSRSEKITKNFDLVCFGGPPFNKRELQLMAVPGRSVKVFHVSGDDRLLAALYRSAAAFVYPSLYEGFGLPCLEAMTYRCPVLTSHVSAIPEVLGDAAAYFDPENPESISSVLEKVLFEKKQANLLVQKGSSQVKKYSWSKMAEETYQVYKELNA